MCEVIWRGLSMSVLHKASRCSSAGNPHNSAVLGVWVPPNKPWGVGAVWNCKLTGWDHPRWMFGPAPKQGMGGSFVVMGKYHQVIRGVFCGNVLRTWHIQAVSIYEANEACDKAAHVNLGLLWRARRDFRVYKAEDIEDLCFCDNFNLRKSTSIPTNPDHANTQMNVH